MGKKLLRIWKCKGEIKLKDGSSYPLKFRVCWKPDKSCELVADNPEDQVLSKIKEDPEHCAVIGEISEIRDHPQVLVFTKHMTYKHIYISKLGLDGDRLIIPDEIVSSLRPFSFPPHTGVFVFYIANLEFNGTECLHYPEGRITSDMLRLNIAGSDYLFLKNTDNESRGSREVLPCSLTVMAELEDKESVVNSVNDLCFLLSLAGGQLVDYSGYDYYDCNNKWNYGYGKGLCKGALEKNGQPLISRLPSEDLRFFVENTFTRYLELKNELGLDYVIGYYTKIKREEYLEIECLLCYILLECLADKARGYFKKIGKPIPNDMLGIINKKISKFASKTEDFKKIPKESIRELAEEISDPNPPLPTVIRNLRKHFGVKLEEKDEELFAWRKEFVHKGISQVGPEETYRVRYKTLINFIDRLLLKILGYSGNYCDARKGYNRIKLQ